MVGAGTVVGSGFVLEALLGEGASGEVWRARRGSDVVAVKLLHRERSTDERAASRFRQEISLLERLRHPALPRLWEAEPGFVVMDLAPGLPLSRWLLERSLRNEWPEETRARHILAVLAQALDHAHAQGVVHRDLKPANVCYDEASGRVTLLDLGLAKRLDVPAVVETTVGRVVGTPYYLAPEQISAEPVGPATDVFALSTLAFELLTLRRAWARDEEDVPRALHVRAEPSDPWNTPLAVMQRIRAGLRPRASVLRAGLPVGLDAALARGWAVAPADRPPSAGAWVVLLERAWAGEVVGVAGVPSAVTQAPSTAPAVVPDAPPRDEAELARTWVSRPTPEPASQDTPVVLPALPEVAPEPASQDTPVIVSVLSADTAVGVAAPTLPARAGLVGPRVVGRVEARRASGAARWPPVLVAAAIVAGVVFAVREGPRDTPDVSPSPSSVARVAAEPGALEASSVAAPRVVPAASAGVSSSSSSSSSSSPSLVERDARPSPRAATGLPGDRGRASPPLPARALSARPSVTPSTSPRVSPTAPGVVVSPVVEDTLTRALAEAAAHPEDGAKLTALVDVIQARSARLPPAQRQAIDSAARRALFGGGLERARVAAELLRRAEAAP